MNIEQKVMMLKNWLEGWKKITNDPTTSETIKVKAREKIENILDDYYDGPSRQAVSLTTDSDLGGADHFASPKKTREWYGLGINAAKERKRVLKDKFYSNGIDPNTRKPGRFAKESVDELKLEIYESCYYGEISEEERDTLLNLIY